MDILEIENKVAEIRGRPLRVVCVTSKGAICTTSLRECWESGGRFLHVAADELDAFLGAELGGDNEK